MVGVGETDDEVYEALTDLRRAGADIVTLGQYLRPSERHYPVSRYVTPEQFEIYSKIGYERGFSFVASGPLVRSSYHAAEGFVMASQSGTDSSTEPLKAVVLPPDLVPETALLRPRPSA